MGQEVMEFVRNLPYETHLHNVYEADQILYAWRNEIPEQIPDDLDAIRFFEAHVLHEAGYDHINSDDSWMELPECDNDVFFANGDITFQLRVWPDGIYVRHKGNDRGCIWTDWERVTQ